MVAKFRPGDLSTCTSDMLTSGDWYSKIDLANESRMVAFLTETSVYKMFSSYYEQR